MSQTYEIEIKSLLGSKDNADSLKERIMNLHPETKLISHGKQLNHYFNTPEDLTSLFDAVSPIIPEDKIPLLKKILEDGKKISVRTREVYPDTLSGRTDGIVIFVTKASIDDHTSSNGVSRIEFEAVVPVTLSKLDQVLLNAGLTYQAKWSREREEYESKNMKVCIDKNAGYGYLAEFERVLNNKEEVEAAKNELISFMNELGVEELPQDRLERMFEHYNNNWPEYYGTDRIFVVE